MSISNYVDNIHRENDFLCIGDTAIRKSTIVGVIVMDGNLSDKVVEISFTLTGGRQVAHRFNSAAQANQILQSLGLFYSPNAAGIQ